MFFTLIQRTDVVHQEIPRTAAFFFYRTANGAYLLTPHGVAHRSYHWHRIPVSLLVSICDPTDVAQVGNLDPNAAAQQKIRQQHFVTVCTGQVHRSEETQHEFNMGAQMRMHHIIWANSGHELGAQSLQVDLRAARRSRDGVDFRRGVTCAGRKATRSRTCAGRKATRSWGQPVGARHTHLLERLAPVASAQDIIQRHSTWDRDFDFQATMAFDNYVVPRLILGLTGVVAPIHLHSSGGTPKHRQDARRRQAVRCVDVAIMLVPIKVRRQLSGHRHVRQLDSPLHGIELFSQLSSLRIRQGVLNQKCILLTKSTFCNVLRKQLLLRPPIQPGTRIWQQ